MLRKSCLLFVVISANFGGLLTDSGDDNKRICMTEDLLKLLMKTVRGGDFKPEKHVSVNRPAFLAYAKTSSKVGNVIKFDDVETNIGKHYSPSTGVFTVPQNGLYSFGCMIISSGKHHVSYHWMKNDAFLSNGFAPASSHAASQSQNIVLSLKKGDKMYIKLTGGGTIHGGRHSYITAYLL